jgi:DNA-binding protein HU-beta
VICESDGIADFATPRIKGAIMATQMTKSQLIERIATKNELAKKDVKSVMETFAEIGYKELKKNGAFVVPGFAKLVVIKKPATNARSAAKFLTIVRQLAVLQL